jgi:hypothetical protein
MINLVSQRTATTSEYSPCGRREQDGIVGRHLIRGQKEHTARLAEHFTCKSRL